ncbi:MAG: ribosome biogenesis GTP-binding protein YihA/YsxC [Gemmatimonadetes bacterium]|nr:ribosome biogenesis GTP-binding protein YihA/YsxC [Gemmatimonadota bacterium]
MKIRSVEYAGTIAEPGGQAPGDLLQIAFSGRSNVGKSSLINTLLRRTRNKLAHVSGRPGKTRALNFYRVNDAFFLVDLPGHGYARVPVAVREAWQQLIEWYLGKSGAVRGVVHLVDARLAPTEHDRRMVEYLSELGIPALIVLTKMDKLKRSEREKSMSRAMRDLQVAAEQLVPFSSRTGEGREALLDALEALIGGAEDTAGHPTGRAP